LDFAAGMIRRGFLDSESRKDLTELARDGSAAHRLARRANALVLLDDGMNCEAIAKVLLLDDDTIRTWYRLYEEDGIEGLTSFGYEGSACHLSDEQQGRLKAWVTETLPRTTRQVGAWIERECGIEYQGRSGLIVLLHRLGMEHRKPKEVSRKLDPEKQALFILKCHRYGSAAFVSDRRNDVHPNCRRTGGEPAASVGRSAAAGGGG
jgi:transposase